MLRALERLNIRVEELCRPDVGKICELEDEAPSGCCVSNLAMVAANCDEVLPSWGMRGTSAANLILDVDGGVCD